MLLVLNTNLQFSQGWKVGMSSPVLDMSKQFQRGSGSLLGVTFLEVCRAKIETPCQAHT